MNAEPLAIAGRSVAVQPLTGNSGAMTTMMTMNRRALMLGALATGAGIAAPSWAAPFSSTRITVTVRGTGRDVILIPGLASSPGVWNGVLTALPGWRYHLVHVA